MNFKLFSMLLFLSSAVGVFAQAPVVKDNTNPNTPDEAYKIGDVRGNIRRRAVYLPKPPYPREALEAGADGAVKVEIVLGADGRVISAKTISGHPLLSAAAEETARQTVFRKSDAPDPNATETGTLVYNFAIGKESWARIGYALTAIQKLPTLRPLFVPRVAKAFQKDWTEEHKALARLNEMRRLEIETENNNPAADKPWLVREPAVTNGTPTTTLRSEMRVRMPMPFPPTPERIALAQNLTAALQNRLAGDAMNLWLFNTGINLAKMSERLRNPAEWSSAAPIVRESLESAPAGVSPQALEALRNLLAILENERRTIETRNDIGKQISVIFNIK